MPVRVEAVGDVSFGRPEDAPYALDESTVRDVVEGFEEMDAESGELTVCPRALPTPKMPSPDHC